MCREMGGRGMVVCVCREIEGQGDGCVCVGRWGGGIGGQGGGCVSVWLCVCREIGGWLCVCREIGGQGICL